MTPPKLGAKEFEELLIKAAARCPDLHMVRYGTQASVGKDGEPFTLQSLPDFEGAIAPAGNQFIIEAKVCSQSAFPIERKTIKPRQVSHMLHRSRVGVRCFVIIHFNERSLRTKHQPGESRAFEVSDRDPRWQAFVDALTEAKRTKSAPAPQGSINRDLAARISRRVVWTSPKGCKTFLPDLAELLGIQSPQQEFSL